MYIWLFLYMLISAAVYTAHSHSIYEDLSEWDNLTYFGKYRPLILMTPLSIMCAGSGHISEYMVSITLKLAPNSSAITISKLTEPFLVVAGAASASLLLAAVYVFAYTDFNDHEDDHFDID